MSGKLEEILTELGIHVSHVAEFLGIPPPEVLEDLDPDAVSDRDWYLVGLIGGKDVGKSALVNALVGHPITAESSFGPGTEKVVA